MSEKKPAKEGNSKEDAQEILHNMSENLTQNTDEIANVNTNEVQQLSELQKEAAEISQDVVIVTAESENQIETKDSNNNPVPVQVSVQTASQSNELADSFVDFTHLYDKLTTNAIDAMQENARLFGKMMDGITDQNADLLHTWISYWTPSPQQELS